MYDTPFDNWIEYYYDMDDCQHLMEEERDAHEQVIPPETVAKNVRPNVD